MKELRIAIPVIGPDPVNYRKALEAAGMKPVIVTIGKTAAEEEKRQGQEIIDCTDLRVEEYDGLLLPGGADVDPRRYGEENRGSYPAPEELDELQFQVLDQFVRAGKPVLGICRGAQIINVCFGGSLIQHLETASDHARGSDDLDKVHRSVTEAGSWLFGLYGREFAHNSSHHQAAADMGEGLVIDSRSVKDGVVEAFHHVKLPVYAVQWHPERMCLEHERTDTVNGLPVFRFFREICEPAL